HLVDEPPQLLDVDVGQKVGPRRQELAELDVRRAEALEGEAEVARALARRRALADDADLAQHAEQAAPPGDPRHLERTLRPLRPRPHGLDHVKRTGSANGVGRRPRAPRPTPAPRTSP